jgi:hypothetical protein
MEAPRLVHTSYRVRTAGTAAPVTHYVIVFYEMGVQRTQEAAQMLP